MFKVLITILSIWVIYRFTKAVFVLFQFRNSQKVERRRAQRKTGDTNVKYVPKSKSDRKAGKSKIEYTDYEEID